MSIKVCMVTKLLTAYRYKSNYARYLADGLRAFRKDADIIFYTTKGEKDVGMSLDKVKHVWSSNILYPFQILKEVLRDKPEIVHIQHEFTMFGGFATATVFSLLLLLLRLSGVKIVTTIHAVVPLKQIDEEFISTFLSKRSKILTFISKTVFIVIYRMTCTLSTCIIVHNKCFHSYLISDYKANGEKIFDIPIGVGGRLGSLPTKEEKQWAERFKNRKVILYFGLLTGRKGIEYLIEAFQYVVRKHPHYILVLAGGEIPYQKHYVDRLKSLIYERDLVEGVTLTGFIAEEEIHELYYLSHFVVFPYIYSIASSLSLSHAIQHHKPVIATNIGAFREEIRDGKEGILVSPKDAVCLEKAMFTLIENPALHAEMSKNMKKKAKERSWAKVAEMTCAVYKKITQQDTHGEKRWMTRN